ncbi:MAG: hypothetical protein JW815_01210 [Candidatus Bathyarchaeota archaeon]|nr:hypothetical protein [Candidatus Bathyarchaeum sp.]
MVEDFFCGFAGHAHTKNDLEADPNNSMKLRRENNVKEAQRLTESVLGKIEKEIFKAGHDLNDVKLLVLYLSYRGENEEKDKLISESILRAIENRFKDRNTKEQLGLIGHTTAGEVENEDLELKQITGIGYNGLSLLALVTNLPIGIGRTWGIRTDAEAAEQGKKMAHEAWININQTSHSKEQLQKSKTLLVLTQGPMIGKLGREYFVAEGIADFIRSTREARISNVIGGCSGDGIIGQVMNQFYGKLGSQSELKILKGEGVCGLLPLVDEPSLGLDTSPVRRIGESHIFHFDPNAKPKFKFVNRIGDKDPREVHARTIYENEAQISRERGLPVQSEKELFQQISEIDGIPLNLTLAKYAFSFPSWNYAPMNLIRVHDETVELLQPVRSHDPNIPGYIVVIDHNNVKNGAWNVCDMLRENRAFRKRDITFIVTCISRRLAEMIGGCTSNTEGQIFKEAFSSTQMTGFLAYGELSFTNLLQEPFVHNFSCWGMTLRSKLEKKEDILTKGRAELPQELALESIEQDLSFEFKSVAAQKTFSYIVNAFIKDYMQKRLVLEKSGWRTRVDIVKHANVAKSSLYNGNGGIGSAISELSRRGLVEIRVFPGARGRGGRITKLRLAYEKEILKRYVDKLVRKI